MTPFKKFLYNPYFSKLFLNLVCMAIIPVIVFSTFLNNTYKKNLEHELSLSNLDFSKQISVSLDNVMYSIRRMPSQISRSNSIYNFFNNDVKLLDENFPNILNSITNSVLSIQEDINYIDSISVYSIKNDMIINCKNSSIIQDASANLSMDILSSSKEKGYFHWLSGGQTDIFGNTLDGIQYMEYIFESYNKPIGVIFINLNRAQLCQTIYDLGFKKNGNFFVINSRNDIILSDIYNNDVPTFNKIISNYAKFGNKADYETLKLDNSTLLVSHCASSLTGFKNIFYLPTSAISDKSDFARKTLLYATLLLTFIAILMAYFLTKKFHMPIDSLEDLLNDAEIPLPFEKETRNQTHGEFERISSRIGAVLSHLDTEKNNSGKIKETNVNLKKQLDESINVLQQYFLYRIIYEDIELQYEEIEKQSSFLNMQSDGKYVVIIFESNVCISNTSNSLTNDEKIEMWGGIESIFEKILPSDVVCLKMFKEHTNESQRTICILSLNTSIPNATLYNNLKINLKYIKDFIEETFDFSLSISCGTIQSPIYFLQNSFRDAKRALKYRFVIGNDDVLFSSDTTNIPKLAPDHYFEKRHFINILSTRKIESVEAFLNNIKNDVLHSHESCDFIYRFKDILNTIIEFLSNNNYELNITNVVRDTFKNFEDKFKSMDSVIQWIVCFLSKLFADDGDKEKSKYSPIVEKSMKIIEENYRDNIGLCSISTSLSISESYLSKLFKDDVGTNFKEYLTNYRIHKAKEQLSTTNLTILQISEKVGYNNYNQFAKMFKKCEGISPSEYRSHIN